MISQVTIDNFLIQNLFFFDMAEPLEQASDTRVFTAGLHTVLVAFKDQFKIRFPKLTQAQANQLNQLIQQTGLNAFHTVIYQTDYGTRQWDGLTPYAAGYGINDDVGRLRNKIRFKPIKLPHWQNQAGFYTAELDGMEV